MAAFKKIEGRFLYVDMEKIHVPSWKAREAIKASQAKTRALKKIDPFARCVGRRRAYETPEQLKAACDAYFKSQECIIFDKYGKPMVNPETGEIIKGTHPLTLSGLGLHLGIPTHSLKRYRAIAESGTVPYAFAEVVTEALQKVEAYAERRIYDKDGQRGAQFILQTGFKWKTDKERRETVKLSTENKIALEKLEMQKEEHKLKMKVLQSGLEGDIDSDINIVITRAKKGSD